MILTDALNTTISSDYVLYPQADTYAFNGESTQSHGAEDTLRANYTGNISTAFIKYDISKIEKEKLENATLRLYAKGFGNPSVPSTTRTVKIRSNPVTDWDDGISASEMKQIGLWDLSTLPSDNILSSKQIKNTDTMNVYYEFDVTEAIAKAEDGYITLQIIIDEPAKSAQVVLFDSKEGTHKPQLILNME